MPLARIQRIMKDDLRMPSIDLRASARSAECLRREQRSLSSEQRDIRFTDRPDISDQECKPFQCWTFPGGSPSFGSGIRSADGECFDPPLNESDRPHRK